MRTKCANCGMIYDIFISDMEMRTPQQIAQSGVCPKCGSNAHNPIPIQYSNTNTNFENDKKESL